MSSSSGIRLNKFISDSGYCSRREADKLIDNKRVKINGKRPELGTKVEPGDEVTVDDIVIDSVAVNKSDRVYLAYNKPVGITCTTDQAIKGNIVDAIDHDERIFPIGRLDKPSEGLILLTNDGDIVNKILRAENAHEKEYLVTLDKNMGSDFVDKMSNGVPILDTITKPCKVVPQGRNVFKITLTQGLNRQIRRMCSYLGYTVKELRRLRIMNIELGRLKLGQWRNLSKEEMEQLNSALAGSSGEASAKSGRDNKKPRSKAKPKSRPHASSKPKSKSKSNSKPGSGKKKQGGPHREDNENKNSPYGKKTNDKKRGGKGKSSGKKVKKGSVGRNAPQKTGQGPKKKTSSASKKRR